MASLPLAYARPSTSFLYAAPRTWMPGTRPGMTNYLTPSLRGAKRRSNPILFRDSGLLRGACHRARVRATRWLAMTIYRLPNAVETMIAVVLAAAAVAAPPAAIRNPEHALDRAHRAADAGADRAANHTAHGAGDPASFVGTLLRPAHDALGMTDRGNREQCEQDCRSRNTEFYRQSDGQHRCSELCLHLDSFCS